MASNNEETLVRFAIVIVLMELDKCIDDDNKEIDDYIIKIENSLEELKSNLKLDNNKRIVLKDATKIAAYSLSFMVNAIFKRKFPEDIK